MSTTKRPIVYSKNAKSSCSFKLVTHVKCIRALYIHGFVGVFETFIHYQNIATTTTNTTETEAKIPSVLHKGTKVKALSQG